MLNETDVTKRPQTQPEEQSDSSSTHIVAAIDVAIKNTDDGATRTAPGRQLATTNIWISPKPQKIPNNKMKAPKLSKKIKHLQPFFES